MSTEDVKLIKLRHGSAGLVGLPEVLEAARSRPFSSEEELKTFLLQGIKANNFVPRGADDEYAEALFREYKKFIGEPLPEEPAGVLEIRILGAGCPRCRALERATMAALAELNIPADLQHVTNLTEIAQYGIVATPALVINGKVKSAGRVLNKKQIMTLLSADLPR